MRSFIHTPIKANELPDTDTVPWEETNEPFVDIYEYSNKEIKVNMQYAKKDIASAVNVAYVREGVAKKLLQAKDLLPAGYTFEILDAWRPFAVQLSLYNAYKEQVLKSCPSDIAEEELKKLVCEFVSFPDKNSKITPVHCCGGAVDLTIIDENGKRLNMGGEFDEFSPKAYTAWYEKNDLNTEIRNNRRLLHNIMTECGFSNLPSEWWHYDFGDAFWSFYTGKKAIYTSKFELKEVEAYEQLL